MLAAVSMTRVEGSRVSKAAVMMPCLHFSSLSIDAARDMADRDEEHAVSMLTEGPASKIQKLMKRFSRLIETRSIYLLLDANP